MSCSEFRTRKRDKQVFPTGNSKVKYKPAYENQLAKEQERSNVKKAVLSFQKKKQKEIKGGKTNTILYTEGYVVELIATGGVGAPYQDYNVRDRKTDAMWHVSYDRYAVGKDKWEIEKA